MVTQKEIANYGEVENGYLITIHFNNIKIPLLLFCSLNEIQPMYATHEALTPAEKRQVITNKFMKGRWLYEQDNDFLKILITEKNVTVEGNIQGQSENKSFASGGYWFEAFVYGFLSNSDYSIFYANENEMGFGKLETPRMINGKYKWQVKLKRTNQI
ncbi:MAG: hypothetical protein WAQ28_09135 [Bacteroidia bacterium]